jgi:hypothetical protein
MQGAGVRTPIEFLAVKLLDKEKSVLFNQMEINKK